MSCPKCGAPPDAAARIADLEAQLQLLKSKVSATTPEPPQQSATARISAFLSALPRRGTPTPHPPSPTPPSPPPEPGVAHERALRLKAEEKLQQVTSELEELSASLFESANEMVAEERRLRSRLEERVMVLEKREKEKRERLGVLEGAVERIGRVRELLTGKSPL